MARSSSRLAAGVGVVSVFLLLGGSGAAVAFGDPGGSRGSDQQNSSDRGDDSRGGYRGGGKGDDDRDSDGPRSANREGSDDISKGGSSERPPTRVGSGREDTARLSPGGADSDSGGGSGSASSGATSAFEPPKVTFGNGREPGIQRDDPQPRWRAPSPQPAEQPPPPPPPPAPPAQAPSLVDRIVTPPTVVRQFVVAPAAELTDPLWGIASLLLIPAAGAALGYRQARATQSAERLRRS